MKEQEFELQENIAIVTKMIYGNWMQQVTFAFADLGIADALFDSSLSYEELVENLQLNPFYLKRFLRCAMELGYVEYDIKSDAFSITNRGALLSQQHPNSKNAEARLNGFDFRYNPWGNLANIIRYGHGKNDAPSLRNGTLDYLKNKSLHLKLFHEAMTQIWEFENDVITQAYDFSKFDTVMDIGCGEGSFLKSILNHNNHLNGIMFDLPETFKGIPIENNRIRLHSGDFFEEIPDSADIYTMKNVIHNWPHNKVVQLLKNVQLAMSSTKGNDTDPLEKRLLIIENVLPENNAKDISNWMDLNFMILVDGMERTKVQYEEIGQVCGLKLIKIYSTGSNRKILEFRINY